MESLSARALCIQFRAQLRLRRRALAEQARNDSVAMKATVFDEYLVRIVTGDHDSRDEQPGYRCFESVGVVVRYAGFRIYRHTAFAQEFETRRKTGHDVYAVRLQATFVLTRRKDDVPRFDRLDATVPFYGDLPFLHAVGKIGQHPRLDFLVERWTEVNECHSCA